MQLDDNSKESLMSDCENWVKKNKDWIKTEMGNNHNCVKSTTIQQGKKPTKDSQFRA